MKGSITPGKHENRGIETSRKIQNTLLPEPLTLAYGQKKNA